MSRLPKYKILLSNKMKQVLALKEVCAEVRFCEALCVTSAINIKLVDIMKMHVSVLVEIFDMNVKKGEKLYSNCHLLNA